ncbi:RnfABCDGE type electron transport complex subunit D [Pseudomonadota bacterium]
MNRLRKTLEIGSSPHINSGASVDRIMHHVLLALLPTAAFAVYLFGLAGLLTLITATASCMLTEQLHCKLNNKPSTLFDGSAAITGLIYGLTLPPGLPLWMVVIGGIVAMLLGKIVFGGLGCNPFNPALVGRVFLQAAFPTSMTTWMPALSSDRFHTLPSSVLTLPFMTPSYDAVSAATPLALMKFEGQTTESLDLMLGLTAGSTGESCAVLILLGGLYLIARHMMNWRIPVGIFSAVFIFSAILYSADSSYPSPMFMLFSGGLMLGAMFMATDMVASPLTHWGCFIYGVLIGSIVVILRVWGGMPEGVMYAILLANAVSPHIDRFVQPLVFGSQKQKIRNRDAD